MRIRKRSLYDRNLPRRRSREKGLHMSRQQDGAIRIAHQGDVTSRPFGALFLASRTLYFIGEWLHFVPLILLS